MGFLELERKYEFSHEVRRGAQGASRVVPGKSGVDAILVESDRLSRMVTELLDFSRLEKGTRRYNLETFDLAAFAAQDAEVQAVSAISHGRARIAIKGTGMLITADPFS